MRPMFFRCSLFSVSNCGVTPCFTEVNSPTCEACMDSIPGFDMSGSFSRIPKSVARFKGVPPTEVVLDALDPPPPVSTSHACASQPACACAWEALKSFSSCVAAAASLHKAL